MAGLHSDIKAQISAKLQSLDTKEKLLTAAAEIEAAVRPKNEAAALMAVDSGSSSESSKIREMQREIDAIRSRFGNLNLQQGGGARRKERQTGKGSNNQPAGQSHHRGEGGRTQAMGVLHQVQAMGPALSRQVPQVSGRDPQTYTAGQGQRRTVPETLRYGFLTTSASNNANVRQR